MAIAFRSGASTTYASRTNTTVSAPAGLTNDDILLLTYVQIGTGTPAAPSLFAAVDTGTAYTTVTDAGGVVGRMFQWWKRAASESGSYTVTHSATNTQAYLRAYSGCITSGSPIDAFSKAVDSGGGRTSTAPGITTTADDTMLVWASHDWEGTGTLSPPSGFTERFDGLVYSADVIQATAGASGDKTQTNGNGGNNAYAKWAAWLIALKPAAGGGGSQTITGALVSNSQTFYGATVAPGAVSISGSLFSNSNSFFGGVVSSRYTVTGTRFDNSNSFYGATVAPGAVIISGALYTDPDTFYGATIGRGEIGITGALFTNTNAFYGATISASYTIQGALFTDGDTFYSATVTPGAATISGALFTNTNTFYQATISQPGGATQDITGALFTNSNSFYGGTVKATYAITGSRYDNANSFYGATITTTAGITGARFDNQNQFFAATILVEQDQDITGTRFDNDNTFFPASIGFANTRQPGGFLPTILVDRHGRPVNLKKKANEVLTKARAVARELPVEEKQEAKIAIRDLAEAVTAQHVRELQEALSGADRVLDRVMAELARLAEEAEDEDDVEFLLMAS